MYGANIEDRGPFVIGWKIVLFCTVIGQASHMGVPRRTHVINDVSDPEG